MDMTTNEDRLGWAWLRWVGWGGAVALVLAPLVAMRVAPDSGVNWSVGDFFFAILMIGGTGLLLELVVRKSPDWPYRGGAALALATGFLLIWANLAVGYIGSEDNPYNGVFFLVVAVAVVGAFLGRFRSRGMARAMGAAAAAHAIAGGIGYPQDSRTGLITILFVGMWLVAAALFHVSARRWQPSS